MLIELEARHLHVKHYSSSMTMQCMLQKENGALSSTLDSRLMAIPNILNSVSFILLGVGACEFICAQTPYSMRGLIFGCAKASGAIFILVGYGISKPFTQHLIDWGTGIISCAWFRYLLMILLLMVIYTVILLIIKKNSQEKKERRCTIK